MAVLAEELNPVHATLGCAPVLPRAGVEHQLGLIDHEQDRILADGAAREVLPRVRIEELGREIGVGAVAEQAGVIAQIGIDVEVANDGTALVQKGVAYVAGDVKALAAARGTAVKVDHINSLKHEQKFALDGS